MIFTVNTKNPFSIKMIIQGKFHFLTFCVNLKLLNDFVFGKLLLSGYSRTSG